jgi:hypothetical protein
MVGLDMGKWGGDDNWHKCLVKAEHVWVQFCNATIFSFNFDFNSS